ncbi:sodium:proton antiporter [Nocardia cyriacigeorgica]|uniref:cation:proton antiporter n=1 Tax=Nocardia cyriacigeorgica TaxID=135487 RepID=UPI001893783B|nr:sodium:proton antiporter [Nocardia cyriacigeorgica]MBF6098675.1 sodium:proton antiporter [Nocardia cyriacigeorgica]MBF6162430.1 sodium:proton antiporter [Nocardia cyriacigeorgica]MBF6201389.1 sodium:proton antiporter [Nocardia cyriacigeorgica]
MEITLVVVVGIIAIVVVAAFSDTLGVAAPLSLAVVGIALSFVPGIPHPEVEPELILTVVLPPLLYSAAVNMPAVDFRRNLKPIAGLAVLLVVVTTLGTGWLFHQLLPDIGWPAAFALGAVISPTDPIAATSVGKRLGLPSRLLTMLEGEGLVNDATALVLLRSAVAALAATVSLWQVLGDFVVAVVVAVIAGLLVGWVGVRARAMLDDPVATTAVSFVIPFLAYLPAEEFHGSGVLAVVVAGLVSGHLSPRHLGAQDRLVDATNWRTVAFLLESAIFLLMGLSLSGLIDDVRGEQLSAAQAFGIGLLAALVVMVIRAVFIVPLVASLRLDQRRAAEAKPRLEQISARLADTGLPPESKRVRMMLRRLGKVSATVEFRLTETVGARGGAVLAWSGMRGAVTVAAAQTLPAETPMRSELVLIAFVVAITTLLVQGLSLPTVIRVVRVPGDDPERLHDDVVELRTLLSEAAEDVLDTPGLVDDDGNPYPETLVGMVRDDTVRKGSAAQRDLPAAGPDPREQYRQLRLRVVAAQRAALLRARDRERFGAKALARCQHMLDLDEARLQQLGRPEA